MNHQTCWWNRIWVYCFQSLLWREQIVFQTHSNLMHLNHLKAVICFMFWLLAFEAEFFLKQLFLNRIELRSSEFLSRRNWWRKSSNQCADDRANSLSNWCFDDWLSIQFSQSNIDLHANVNKLVQVRDSFIEHCSLKIWADLMLKICQKLDLKNYQYNIW